VGTAAAGRAYHDGETYAWGPWKTAIDLRRYVDVRITRQNAWQRAVRLAIGHANERQARDV
jgi:hypothetical protein